MDETMLYGTMELESSHSKWLKNRNFCVCYCEAFVFAYVLARCLRLGRSTVRDTATRSRADVLYVREWRGTKREWGDIWRQEDLHRHVCLVQAGVTPQRLFRIWLMSTRKFIHRSYRPEHSKAHEEDTDGPIHGNVCKVIFFLHKPQSGGLQTLFHQSLGVF